VLLSGKKALVTGASRGIGKAIAEALAAEGADVALVATNQGLLEEVAAQVTALGRKALVKPLNVADGEAVAAGVKEVAKELGGLDIVVNNAGITSDQLLMRHKEEDWQRVLDINLTGAFRIAEATAPGPGDPGFPTLDVEFRDETPGSLRVLVDPNADPVTILQGMLGAAEGLPPGEKTVSALNLDGTPGNLRFVVAGEFGTPVDLAVGLLDAAGRVATVQVGTLQPSDVVLSDPLTSDTLLRELVTLGASVGLPAGTFVPVEIPLEAAVAPTGFDMAVVTGLRLTLTPHHGFDDAPPIDILVLPSTVGSMDRDLEDERLVHDDFAAFGAWEAHALDLTGDTIADATAHAVVDGLRIRHAPGGPDRERDDDLA